MTDKPLASAADILALADRQKLKTKRVDIPELGKSVIVRELKSKEAQQFANDKGRLAKLTKDANAKLVRLACVDEDGKPIFSDVHIEQLENVGMSITNRIAKQAAILSGLLPEDGADEAEEPDDELTAEEIEKN